MRWLLVALVAVLVAACTAQPAPRPVVVDGWEQLPAPAAGARVLAMVPDGDGLLVLGSVPGPRGRAPAGWTTTDGHVWRAVPLRPATFYGNQAELVAAGVAGGRITVLGQAFGGAHSNPRMTVWSGTATGLAEHEQPFEMFGGPHAINVSDDAAALPGSSLLVGQWDGPTGRYGAAVWTSPDGGTWHRDADDPALASAPGEQTSALGAAAGPPGFVVSGDTQRGSALVPLLWTSPDGRAWHRVPVPTSAGNGVEADRVACDGTGCVLAGSAVSGTWQALCWPVTRGTTVGPARRGPTGGTLQVSQILLHGNDVYDALRVDDTGRLEHLDRDCTHWSDVPLPVRSAEIRVGTLASGVLLATTDPAGSRLWLRR
ncbi:MAG TPA: hypothetical protein VHF06_30440 [Pseudonocardiaceae bacterium]|jgi:hypothetical protein|nr:hypothetical protein [Pseudonocardiaceae bacterium]